MSLVVQVGARVEMNSSHLLLRTRDLLRPIIIDALFQLEKIFFDHLPDVRYAEETQRRKLEDNLFVWAKETLDLNLEVASEQDIVEIFSTRVLFLMSHILICPITQITNRNPVCFHDWVVDKIVLSHLDVFDGHPITNSDDYPPHQFAQEILNWLKTLIDKVVKEDPARSQEDLFSLVLSLDPTRPQRAYTVLTRQPSIARVHTRQMAVMAVQNRDVRAAIPLLQREIVQFEAVRRESEEFMQREIARAKASFDAHEVRVNEGLAAVEKAVEKRAEVLESRLKNQEEVGAINKQTLNLVESRLQKEIGMRQGLEGQVANYAQAAQQSLAKINSQDAIIKQQAARIEDLSKKTKGSRGCVIQ